MTMKSLVTVERIGDGLSVEIKISPIGQPRLTVTFPTAGLGFSDNNAMAEYLTTQVEELKAQGWHVVNMRAVRNPLLDAPGQKTTLEVTIRPCMNEHEADEARDFIIGKMRWEGKI